MAYAYDKECDSCQRTFLKWCLRLFCQMWNNYSKIILVAYGMKLLSCYVLFSSIKKNKKFTSD